MRERNIEPKRNNSKHLPSVRHPTSRLLAAVLSLIMVFALAVGAGSIPVRAASGTDSAAISKTKLALVVNKSKTLKLTGVTKKVKWTVYGRKLVTIKTKGTLNQKAVIKAGKKTGTCYVVAKTGGNKYKCKVQIRNRSGFSEKTLSKSSKNKTASFQAKTTPKKKADSTFINAMANTSVKLLQETFSQDAKKENILISPDSLLTAMSVVENGAHGRTFSEFKKAMGGISAQDYSKYLSTLHKRLTASEYIKYRTANSIWYREGEITLKKPYLQRIVNYFNAEIYAAPFSSKTIKDINSWVYNKTQGKIPSIIDSLNPSIVTAVINAVYFKGKWAEPYFDTVKRNFTLADGTKKKANMLEDTEHTYVTVNGAKGFVKYYEGGETAFMGLLPPKGTSVEQFVSELNGTDLINGYNNRITENIDVYTRMPEFNYDYTTSMVKPMQNIGIRAAFTDEADFSRISNQPMRIDEVIHKTHIELNKNGTEAAAATAMTLAKSSMPIQEKIVKKVYLNRPFVYALIDTQTGIPLFIGTVDRV